MQADVSWLWNVPINVLLKSFPHNDSVNTETLNLIPFIFLVL